MPDPSTGIIAATSVLGGAMSANSASKANKAANAAEKAQLDFAKQQYADWKAVFGPLQDNLATYYNNLTPARIEAQGRQAIELERDQWLSRIDTDMAARGLTDSALAGSAVAGVERDTAIAKATVSATAEQQAVQQKLNFLSLGYNQNPANNVQSTLNQQAESRRAAATDASQAAGSAIGSSIGTIGSALSDYFGGTKA